MRRGTLGHYLLIRFLLSIPMVLILLTLVFMLLHATPGDPVTATVGSRLPPDEIAARKQALGLDQPLYMQYLDYLGQALQGNFGQAVTDRRSVLQIVGDTAPATMELVIASMIVAVIVGISVGALAGRLRDTAFDIGGRFFGILIYATPLFWSALLAQLYFSANLHWLPSSGRIGGFYIPEHITGFYTIDSLITGNWQALSSTLSHLALPAITLGLLVGGVFVRLVRVNMLQSLRSDYIEAARARGIPERNVVYRHAFKNALIPVITIMGLQFALMIGNATLTETIFSWPGLARAMVNFIGARDYAAVQGIVTFIALIVVGVSLLIDVINAFIDPRVRYS
ncbi:ABC transporter permease [Salinisphaera sp. USBA-960]|uniref:ABC transporter permease n=1 Tax=Salinisphaera orenii TaxID=856731 RepID=UPI000DBE4295|nr:ABC transporter permease [Salifodinibacter halophilus]NNC26427.1 ABC transporter permease [Salifodinibacter halophilus]